MVISQEDFKEMTVCFGQATRTSDSERYFINSDDPEAGEELSYSSRNASRVGILIIQYASGALSRPFVGGTIILETEWEEKAINGLVTLVDERIVGSIGAGMKTDRDTFDVSVYVGESIAEYTEPITREEDRGLYGIHKQMRRTQEMVESLPETIDEVIAEQYEEIEDIIESQELNEEEKRRRVRDKLRVGIEMGLPTAIYERSSEDRE